MIAHIEELCDISVFSFVFQVKDLSKRSKEMDGQELTRLAELYSGLVFRVAYCYVKNCADADDIMQDVFLALYTYKKDFRDDEHIRAWLIRVTSNRCKNLLSSYRYRMSMPLEMAENIPASEQKHDDLLPVIMKLDQKYRIVLYMYYYEEYSVNDIAEALGIKQTAVTTRLSRGRKLLKELLIKEGYHGL